MKENLRNFILRAWAELWISHPTLSKPIEEKSWNKIGAELLSQIAQEQCCPSQIIDQFNYRITELLDEPWTGIYPISKEPPVLDKYPGDYNRYERLAQNIITAPPIPYALKYRSELSQLGKNDCVLFDFRHTEIPDYATGLAQLLPLIPSERMPITSSTRLQRGFKGSAPLFFSDDIITRELHTTFGATANSDLAIPPLYLSSEEVSELCRIQINAKLKIICSVLSGLAFRTELAALAGSGCAEVIIDYSVPIPQFLSNNYLSFENWCFSTTPSYLSCKIGSERNLYTKQTFETSNLCKIDSRTKWILASEKILTAIKYFGIPYQERFESIQESFRRAQHKLATSGDTDCYPTLKAGLAALNDSHVFRIGQPETTCRKALPFRCRKIENTCVIVAIHPHDTMFRNGDLLLKIDNCSVSDLMEKYKSERPHSTTQSLELTGIEEQGAFSIINDRDTVTLVVQRGEEILQIIVAPSTEMPPRPSRETDFFWAQNNTCYFDLSSPNGKSPKDFDWGAFDSIILDIRGTIQASDPFDFIPYLINGPIPYPTLEYLIRVPSIQYSSMEMPVQQHKYSEAGALLFPKGDHKRPKRTFILIDAHSISWLETFLLTIKQEPSVTLVGAPTSGANGNVSDVTLPDSSRLYFGCMGVLNNLGENSQNIGIAPHVLVETSISDVKCGHDTVLRRSLELCGWSEVEVDMFLKNWTMRPSIGSSK